MPTKKIDLIFLILFQAHGLLWTDPALYSQDNISAAFVVAASGAHAAQASLGDSQPQPLPQPQPQPATLNEPLPVFQVRVKSEDVRGPSVN